MNCTTTTHIWLWFGAGTGSACDDHVRCQCGAYTYGEWHSLRDQNARLQALLAERDAEIVLYRGALSDIQFDLINCPEAAGSRACEHLHDAIRIVNAALAARGDQG